jgi:hypothetical protein
MSFEVLLPPFWYILVPENAQNFGQLPPIDVITLCTSYEDFLLFTVLIPAGILFYASVDKSVAGCVDAASTSSLFSETESAISFDKTRMSRQPHPCSGVRGRLRAAHFWFPNHFFFAEAAKDKLRTKGQPDANDFFWFNRINQSINRLDLSRFK